MTSSTWDTVTKPRSMQPMTTLERQGIRNVAEALRHEFGLTDDQVLNVLAPALWAIHDKATEAAAKKCDDLAWFASTRISEG